MGNGDSVKPTAEKQNSEHTQKEERDELAILKGEGRTYTVAGEVIEQKPLVVENITKGFELVMAVLSTFLEAYTEEESEEEIEPNMIFKLMTKSKKFMGHIVGIISLAIGKDAEFVNKKVTLPVLSKIIYDFWELNEVGIAIENFQNLALKVMNLISKEIQGQK